MAADADVAAIYELGRLEGITQAIIAGFEPSINDLSAPVRQRHVDALFDAAGLYVRDDNMENALILYERATEKGHPPPCIGIGALLS